MNEEMIRKCQEYFDINGKISCVYIQRKFQISFDMAMRILNLMVAL